jgi:glycosyltransferase Alg8
MKITSELLQANKQWGFPAELELQGRGPLLKRGANWRWQWAMLVALVLYVVVLAATIGDVTAWLQQRAEIIFVLGGIAAWRWGWFIVQSVRAMLYRYWVFPRLRRQAERAASAAEHGPVPEVTILAVTYHERPWITEAVFESLYRELSTLSGLVRSPRLVVATGCEEDDQAIQRVHAECSQSFGPGAGATWPPELILLRDDTGKRPALAGALREIAASQPHPDGVVLFLDGDTLLQPGLLKKVLPLFRLKPEVSAVTTDEDGWVQGPRWFAEWISLRLGLRHRTMCSVALSGKLLCLTGRLSVFRASVALDPSFLEQIERDSIQHWLWGSFDMLSGDDKSTWYWLAARGRRLLYVPDARATTIEVVDESPMQRALANIRRWSGNSLRHGWRAFTLGPQKLGWFCWYSLLDQRLAIWTVLVGPLFALLAVCAGRIELAAAYLLWVMVSRLCHSAIAWRHGRRLSAFYMPLQIASDWVTSIIKAWTLFHPAKQAWLNRGARRLDAQKTGASPRLRAAAAHYLYAFACITMVILIGTYTRFVPVVSEAPLFIDGRPEGVGSPQAPLDESGSGPAVMFGSDGPLDDGAHPRTHASSSSSAREIEQSRIAAAAPPPRPPE